ncbi:hypothetical protein ACFU96_47425 [Streptomyces sp. NPDC057620]|uniref:hypothetical protein n=1 Tax=Streptomyces sp. NPDC057620 TaxID=3346185 RepID=UPI0036D0FEFC
MSERSRGPADPPRDMVTMWERTRELGRQLHGVNGRLETLEGQKLADAVEELSLVVKKLTQKPEAAKVGDPVRPGAAGDRVGDPAGRERPRLPGGGHDVAQGLVEPAGAPLRLVAVAGHDVDGSRGH